ncbi:MAG: alpha/beta fold hydrolase [Chloroflexi bacterium]|nr:alpha/beta fold hydrolase [Chloroflexota bacterium]
MFPTTDAFTGDEHRPFTLVGHRGVVLLVHGFPGTADDLRPLAEELHAADWTVEAMLLPGFGPEIAVLSSKTALDWKAAVVDKLGQLRRRHGRVVVVGHSLGGALAISASAGQSLDGLVLLAPFHRINHILWQALPVLRFVMPQFKPFRLFTPDFDDPEFRKNTARMMPGIDLDRDDHRTAVRDFAVPVNLFAQIRAAGVEAYASAPKVHSQTLVVQGREDTLVLPANTRKLAARLGGTVQHVEIPGDHNLNARDKRSWPHVRDAVLRFLQVPEVERAPA